MKKTNNLLNTRNKRNLFAVILIGIIGLVGITFAYFTTTSTFKNLFNTPEFSTTVYEVFESPDNWTPGTTTKKEVYATNNSNVDVVVRISYEEEWTAEDGSELPLEQNGNRAAIINLSNEEEWTKKGNYYYYNENLKPSETTSSFMESVTFNPEITGTYTCTTNEEGHDECTSTGTGYDGATYKLTIKVEMFQSDMPIPEEVTDTTCFDFDPTTGTITGFSDDYTVEKCGTDIIFPTTIDGVTVQSIGSGAFADDQNITGASFLDDTQITTIKSGAFYNTKLTKLQIPSTITNLESGAFYNTSATLKTLSVEAYFESFSTNILVNVNNYFGSALSNVDTLTIKNHPTLDSAVQIGTNIPNVVEVVLDENLTEIQAASFQNTTKLKKINLPQSLTKVGANAFINSGLEYLEIPKNLTSWYCSFMQMPYLTKVVMEDGLKLIDERAFHDSPVQIFEIPDSVEVIKPQAFYNTRAKEIVLPKNLKEMESLALYIPTLETLTVNSNITHRINKALSTTSDLDFELKNIILTSNVTEIDFAGRGEKVENPSGSGIPETVTKIVVPKTITNVRNLSFQDGSATDSLVIYYEGTEEEFNNIIVDYTYDYENYHWFNNEKVYNYTE